MVVAVKGEAYMSIVTAYMYVCYYQLPWPTRTTSMDWLCISNVLAYMVRILLSIVTAYTEH